MSLKKTMKYFTFINIKKLKRFKIKSFYLIVPISILLALSILVSSHTNNLQNAIEESIFGTIEEQGRLIELTKQSEFGRAGGGVFTINFGGSDSNYSDSDLANIESIDGVSNAQILREVPVSNVFATGLFDSTSFSLNSLKTLNSDLAVAYTDENFSYTEGDTVIPIILNANSFVKTYEDWDDSDTITQTLSRPTEGSRQNGPPEIKSPVKTEALDYSKSELLGKEFKINVGGLDSIETYSTSFESSQIIYKKYSNDELLEKEKERKGTISKYWDYDKISTPLEYTFKVVGVIESDSDFSSYIPESFAEKMMRDLINKQLSARNSATFEENELGNIYNGLNFDGVELTNSSSNIFGAGAVRINIVGQGGPFGGSESDQVTVQSYNIPGLVIETKRSQSNGNPFGPKPDILGEYKNSNVFSESLVSGSKIIIKTDDIYSRTQVVKSLNDAGYAYQDLYKLDVFNEIENAINIASIVTTVLFVFISIFVVIVTMGKYVSESKKEIGILRSLGAKKSYIRNLFISQAVLYTSISYVIGCLAGLLMTFIIAAPLSEWFDNLIGKTIKESFNVVVNTPKEEFFNIDVHALGIYTLILFLIVIIISIVPAVRASKISPVDAIRSE